LGFVAALALVSATLACAQTITATPFESVVPGRAALEIISTDSSAWVTGQAVVSPKSYVMEFSGLPGASFKRTYDERTTALAGAPLNIGVSTNLRDELAVALGARGSMQFSRTQSQTRDTAEAIRSGGEVQSLSLLQAFGAGASVGSLNFQRDEAVTRLDRGKYQTMVTESMALQAGQASGLNLASAFKDQRDTSDPFGLRRTEMSAALGAATAGGAAKLAFGRTTQTQGVHSQDTTTTDFTTPLRMFGGAASFEHHVLSDTKDDVTATTRSTKFATPLPYRDTAFSGELTTWGNTQQAGRQGKMQGWNLALPAFGNKWSVAYVNTDATEGGQVQALDKLDLSAAVPLFGDKVTFERHNDVTTTGKNLKGSRSTHVTTPLTGLVRGALIDYSRQQTIKPGEDVENRTTRYYLPLEQVRKGATFEVVEVANRKNADEMKQRTSKFFAPLDNLRKGATFEYNAITTLQGGATQRVQASTVAVPVSIFGLDTTGTFRSTTTNKASTVEDQEFFNVSTRVGDQVVRLLERQHTTVYSVGVGAASGSGAGQAQVQTYLQSPRVHLLGPRLTVAANQLRNETAPVGQPDVLATTTNVNVAAKLFAPWTVSANFQIADDAGKRTETDQLLTEYQLSKRLSVGGHMEATAPPDAVSTIRRNLFVSTNKAGDSSLGLKAAITTWDQPGATIDDGRLLQLEVGNPKAFGVKAQYAEYDPAKWTRFAQPTIGLELAHGDPSKFSVKVGYEDSQSRVAPRRALEVAMPALGGAVSVGYSENPLQPDGKAVRQAKVYDAGLSKKHVLGSVNLDMRYRYLDYLKATTPEDVTQYLEFKLDGGSENAGGKLALSYLTGDFVPQPDPKKPAAGSIFDISYSKAWNADGRIVLSLRRTTAPLSNPTGEDSTEGRLQYNAKFW